MKVHFTSAALLLMAATVAFGTTHPDPDAFGIARLDYFHFWSPSRPISVPIDSDPEAVPSYLSTKHVEADFNFDEFRVSVRKAPGSSFAALCAYIPGPHVTRGYFALYRERERVQYWPLQPLGNSYRDSFSTREIRDGDYRMWFLNAELGEDSQLRFRFRVKVTLDPDRGVLHQFVLVLRPDGNEYRLSHAEEEMDVSYDARRGVVFGSGEKHIVTAEGDILERRVVSSRRSGSAACGGDELAGRLARGSDVSADEVRDVECLRAVGRLLSRRTSTRPTELYDVAAQ